MLSHKLCDIKIMCHSSGSEPQVWPLRTASCALILHYSLIYYFHNYPYVLTNKPEQSLSTRNKINNTLVFYRPCLNFSYPQTQTMSLYPLSPHEQPMVCTLHCSRGPTSSADCWAGMWATQSARRGIVCVWGKLCTAAAGRHAYYGQGTYYLDKLSESDTTLLQELIYR